MEGKRNEVKHAPAAGTEELLPEQVRNNFLFFLFGQMFRFYNIITSCLVLFYRVPFVLTLNVMWAKIYINVVVLFLLPF